MNNIFLIWINWVAFILGVTISMWLMNMSKAIVITELIAVTGFAICLTVAFAIMGSGGNKE